MSELTQQLRSLATVISKMAEEQEKQEEKKPAPPQKTEWDLGGGDKIRLGDGGKIMIQHGILPYLIPAQIRDLHAALHEIAQIKGISLD